MKGLKIFLDYLYRATAHRGIVSQVAQWLSKERGHMILTLLRSIDVLTVAVTAVNDTFLETRIVRRFSVSSWNALLNTCSPQSSSVEP